MPSLIITGHPAVGKTIFTSLLASRAIAHTAISKVIHITERSACHLSKSECYTTAHAEKETRAALKSVFDQHVTNLGSKKDTLVILDSLNYIKGYRYELYCISKAAGERHGVIWIMGSKSDEERMVGVSDSDVLASQRNQKRIQKVVDMENNGVTGGDYYENHIINELIARFEPPDERNRWENPLYKVDVSSMLPWDNNGTRKEFSISDKEVTQKMKNVHLEDVVTEKPIKSASGFKRNKKLKPKSTAKPSSTLSADVASSSNSSQLSGPMSMAARNLIINTSTASMMTTTHQTVEETIDSILASFLSTQPLKEGMSTANHAIAESNLLNVVDSVTQRVNHEILKAQKVTTKDSSGRIKINIIGRDRVLVNQKQWNSLDLRNLRTQFLKWMASHPSESNEDHIVQSYIDYIESVVGKTSQHI